MPSVRLPLVLLSVSVCVGALGACGGGSDESSTALPTEGRPVPLPPSSLSLPATVCLGLESPIRVGPQSDCSGFSK